MINYLSFFHELPIFSDVNLEDYMLEFKLTLNDCYNNVDSVLSIHSSFTWKTLCQPLSFLENKLRCFWYLIAHLNSVRHDLVSRRIYEECCVLLLEYRIWCNHNVHLYRAYNSLRNGESYFRLNVAQKKTVNNVLLNFKLTGINLSHKEQRRYREILIRLSKLSSIYNSHIIDATLGWNKLLINKNELLGLPSRYMRIARNAAKEIGECGWLLTLHNSCYTSVMSYCNDSKLREELYFSYCTCSSDIGYSFGKWNNGPILFEILILRHELSNLLGFKSYIDQLLPTRMLKNADQVLLFLSNLSDSLKERGKEEWVKLKHFVKKFFNCNVINPWDIYFYQRKEKEFLFSIDEEKFREYFTVSHVIEGMFEVVHRIFGINFKRRYDIDVWHPDVQFFDVFDIHDEYKGGFYLDIYARDNKLEGAWMDICMDVFCEENGIRDQYPIAYLVCNFNYFSGDPELLLTHEEIIILFHEFGHVLHHILTSVNVLEVSGINGVAYDVIEFFSTFMEYFCWEFDVLQLVSSHYKTKKQLSHKQCINLIISKNCHVTSSILHQLFFSFFDFYIHNECVPTNMSELTSIVMDISNKVFILPIIDCNYFFYAFSHIFSDDAYGAGYYSYLWSNVLAADLWSFFKKKGIFNYSLGKLFLDNILSVGGSEDFMLSFTKFCDRKPNIDSFLLYF